MISDFPQVLSSLIQPQCGSLAPPAGQWQRQSQSHQGPDQQAAGLHEHGGAAAGGGPAFSSSPLPGQGPWTGHGHGGGLLAGPRSAAQADRAALAPPVQTPAQETGGAQVTVISDLQTEVHLHAELFKATVRRFLEQEGRLLSLIPKLSNADAELDNAQQSAIFLQRCFKSY